MDLKRVYYTQNFLKVLEVKTDIPYSLAEIKDIIIKNFVINYDNSIYLNLKKKFVNKLRELTCLNITSKIRKSVLLNLIRTEFSIKKKEKFSFSYLDLPKKNSDDFDILNLFILDDIQNDLDSESDYKNNQSEFSSSENNDEECSADFIGDNNSDEYF